MRLLGMFGPLLCPWLVACHPASYGIWTIPNQLPLDFIRPEDLLLDTPPMQSGTSEEPVFVSTFLANITHAGMKWTTGHLVNVTTPIEHFAVLTPDDGSTAVGCGHRITTQDTARINKCAVATNGGFFDMSSGACMGNIVSRGTVVELDESPRVNFGVTKSNKYIIGYFAGAAGVKEFNRTEPIQELIQGMGWLVRDGKSRVDAAVVDEGISQGFLTQKAPRTLVGVDRQGNLLLLEIDGNEEQGIGPDLYETADIAIQFGFVQAVNVDGGGSSTVVIRDTLCSGCGELVQECDGISTHARLSKAPCQRTVTTVMCVL